MPYSHPQPIDKTAAQSWKRVLPGAMALCGTAGYINSVMLGFLDTPVSHMSGAVSRFGLNVADHHLINAGASLLIILGFLFGAMLSGTLVGATKLVPSRRFGVVLMIEGGLLWGATLLTVQKSPFGPMLAAMACGAQNAMSSSYCGLMIRTTHVTGVVTDLGVMIGHWLRHRRIIAWKLKFLLALLSSFGSGIIFGAVCDSLYGPRCLTLVASGCFIAGAVFWTVMHLRNVAESESHELPRTSIFPEN